MLKAKLFFWCCLMSKFPLHRPEATWCILKPESISCSQAFLSPYTTLCKCSWVSGAQTIEPVITGVCNCLGNWQPSWLLAQTVWPEPKWPLANHTLLKSFCIFSLWPSAPSQSNIFFFFPPRHLRNLNSVCRNDRIWSVITLDWMGEI